jgi:hypothetical protein
MAIEKDGLMNDKVYLGYAFQVCQQKIANLALAC